jgi:methionyl aminopeptidase
MEDIEIESYKRAGEIHSEACEIAREQIDVGVSHLDVAQSVESHILEKAGLAFPINISINEEAAHRTPEKSDEEEFTDDDLVCVDIGVHVDGYVADGAFTVDLSDDKSDLVSSTTDALTEAVSMVEQGTDVRDIGERVEEVLQNNGYEPIENLRGHGLSRFEAHDDPKIPNIAGESSYKLQEGDVIAIEPFGSTIERTVKRQSRTNIFELEEKNARIRGRRARSIHDEIEENYPDFPFADRWLGNDSGMGINRLIKNGVIKSNPVLATNEGVVAQAEHTVIVLEDGYEKVTEHQL